MTSFEVSEPILNSPFEKPKDYWYIQEGEQPELREGRRSPVVFPPRDQKEEWTETPLLRRSKEPTEVPQVITLFGQCSSLRPAKVAPLMSRERANQAEFTTDLGQLDHPHKLRT